MIRNAPEMASGCCVSTAESVAASPAAPVRGRKVVTLAELAAGETARVVRVALQDAGCRRRFAELGLGEGMAVTVTAAGETMIVALGGGRMAVAERCAREIFVLRTKAASQKL